MKLKTTFFSLLGAGIVATLSSGCETRKHDLLPQAKISEAQAREIASNKVPDGKIKEIELEREHGKLIWSVDLATPGAKSVTEVVVDAITGAIISTDVESANEESESAAEEKDDRAKSSKADSWNENLSMTDKSFSSTGRNKYFVLEPGFQLVLEGEEDGEKAQLIITVLNETKMVDGVETRVVEERESETGKVIEISRNFFAIGNETHNVYYFGEDVDIYKGGKVVHEGAWLAGVNGAEKGVLIPGDPKVGQKYYQEKAPKVAMDRAENVSIRETIKTPAGSFKDCLKVKETSPIEPGVTEYKIYAPEIGLVKEGGLKLVKYGTVKK